METSRKKKNKVANRYKMPQNTYVNDGFFAKPINEDYHLKVLYDEILWVEAISNYSYIHFHEGKPMSLAINIGKVNADDNAEYATMTVSIPSCPEIQTIHIGSEQYFNGANSEGVPVIFLTAK